MVFFILVIGLAVGSFLNSYIWRLRHGGSAWRGRSYCPKCKKPLRWYELAPLLSFALQRGRCRGCKQKIDWQYPLVELATGILFVLAYTEARPPIVSEALPRGIINLAVSLYLLSTLLILFVYDLRYGLVPDKVVLPAIGVAVLYNVIASVAKQSHNQWIATSAMGGLAMTVGWALLAITVGAGFFWLQYVLSKGRWLGAGDIRIGALMGAMLGWPYVLVALVVSYLIGGLVGAILLISGRKRFGQTVPLGTFLTLGAAITFLYGPNIWNWYFG